MNPPIGGYAPEAGYPVKIIISKYCKSLVLYFVTCWVVHSAFRGLEPYDGKLSRTVVRSEKVDISSGCKSHQNKSQSSVAK
ncbi:MAG: hypothetical protein M0Q38_17350, partial [Bacteroidales bacterium]|nr:hypothetical protein [Bacteroidales bacterium]